MNGDAAPFPVARPEIAAMAGTGARYALYYAPRPEEVLASAAGQWLGRNADSGQARALKPAPGFAAGRLAEITAEPRLYGFHGTLKPPFALAEDAFERELLESVGRFAAARHPFTVAAMQLACLADFLALVPTAPSVELQALAADCTMDFDTFRRPAGEAERARRRAAGLTPRQDELLLRWGYPYVLDQWRFHLTLTGRLRDAGERAAIADLLGRRFSGFIDRPLEVRDLCVFRQPGEGQPFTVLARFTLGGGRRVSSEVWRAS